MVDLKIYLENYYEAQFDELGFVNYNKRFKDHPCNIYIIGGRPRVIIDPDYLEYDNKKVELLFKVQDGYDYRPIKGHIPLEREVKGKLSIESDFPHSRFNLIDEAGYHFHGTEYQNKKDLKLKAGYALRISLPENEWDSVYDLEVYDIGQSLRMNKKISPVVRLKSHNKFQHVLDKCVSNYIDKEVYIILCSFVAKIGLSATGDEVRQLEDVTEFLQKAQSEGEKIKKDTKLITDLAEAALIDYFNTNEFNKDFIGSFGNKSHKYYKQIASSLIDILSVEIDLNNLCRVYSSTISPSRHHGLKFEVKNNFKREYWSAEIKG